jgi:hypothetical protein
VKLSTSLRIFFFVAITLVSPSLLYAFDPGFPVQAESKAYKQWKNQPKSELADLLYLLNRLNESTMIVIYDGVEYKADKAARLAKNFLVKNYHKESAEYWIQNYCYKSQTGQSIIQVRSTDGTIRPARDVIIEELAILKQAKP